MWCTPTPVSYTHLDVYKRQPQIPRFQALRRLSFVVRTVREMQGQFPRECNICGFEGGFLPGGRPPRYLSLIHT